MLTSPAQLPTPTMMNAPTPAALKLRLRSRKGAEGESGPPVSRRKIVKRSAPPRGVNKRRRAIDDEAGRDMDAEEDEDEDVDVAVAEAPEESEMIDAAGPSTPKRLRLTPEVLPMGLERSDFLALQRDGADEAQTEGDGSSNSTGAADENWTDEDDRILVEMVLEKLKLSKSEWQECARNLGRDRGSVGRRWKSLMGAGDVGLKRPRRAKLHATWR